MDELREFLAWCAQAAGSDQKDTFGRSMKDAHFPYGSVSWWVHEYKNRKN